MKETNDYSYLYMTDQQYLDALKRLYERISNGLELVYWDNNTIGNKDTHNSWGLCSNDKEQWPDPDVHLWPDQFIERGRVAPRYMNTETQRCPFDRREWEEDPENPINGCFWTCMFFRPEGRTPPNREQAKALLLTLIQRKEMNLKTG